MKVLSDKNKWIMYDWANSAWVTVVLTALFPVIFREFWSTPDKATQGLSVATIITQVILITLLPFVGAFADSRKISAPLCFAFAVIGSTATAFLYFVPQGSSVTALILFIIAGVSYFLSIAMYDGLLPHVASKDEADQVSLIGYGVGYLGGGLALLLSILILKQNTSLAPLIFLGIGFWWAAFSLPIRSIKQRVTEETKTSLKETILFLGSQKRITLFLLGYWIYIDAINTIIRFAVDFGVSINLPKESVLSALLLTQFIGFPAAFIVVKLSELLGAIRTILSGLCVYAFMAFCAGAFLETTWQFYALAAGIGCVQGGVQALSRSSYSRIIPIEKSAVAFSLFNMVGRLGCFIGPAILYLSAEFTGSSRLGVVSLSFMFLIGGLLLWLSEKSVKKN